MSNKKKLEDIDNSLKDLTKKIDNIKANNKNAQNKHHNKQFNGFSHAFKIVSDLFANILVGGAIGWTLDYYLNTKPILLIFFLIIGFISGIYTSYKSTKKLQNTE
ncbi:AtpZ/AtpI family protein [Alphaproteobacteria bacterium]|nr:AtpZ/AtpI family protein [Alphaproteobacteria bacterium]